MNKTLIKRLSIAALVLIILAIIIIPKLKSKEEGAGSAPIARGGDIPVTIKIIQPEDFTTDLNVSGSVFGNEEVQLRTEVSGKVVAISFNEGTKVSKGDILVKVNDADLQAQLKKAEIKKKDAEEKEYRQRVLLSKNGISRETYETAVNDLDASAADIENIKALIAKTEIRAPFSGTIGLRYISEGSYVTPSTQIASLQSANPVKVDFAIPQRFANEISVGNFVRLKTASGKLFSAKVYALEPKVDPSTRSLQVRAICNNDRGELIPGSYVSVEVNLNTVKNAMVIPSQALALDISGERVFVYRNGIAIPANVESGIRTESHVQISSGIKMGDSVITSGIMQLRPRAKVKILSIEK
ncbi:MAG: RND family efflux transporter MFP subunit [Ignavibacteria bacterium]|nr:MAG: RND family efflux transporter MFP subunit [Ignavibacteria bacterium]KAF0156132.1 MAG: RND family efflux transporter MFP subunit [Ignavibacteria bacterium]